MTGIRLTVAAEQLIAWQVRYWREGRPEGPEVRFWRDELRRAARGA